MLNNVLIENISTLTHCCITALSHLSSFRCDRSSPAAHSCLRSYDKLLLKLPKFPSFRGAHAISDLLSSSI